MNSRRIRKNVLNRDWENKTKQQNINYIKRQLKNLGLELPKYLKNGHLTKSNIQANINKIVRALEKNIENERLNNTNVSLDVAMKRLRKVQEQHNNLVYKKLNYVQQKYNLNENQLNYLLGRDVGIDNKYVNNKFYFRKANSPFTLEFLDGESYSSSKYVMSRIKQIERKNLHLTNKEIDKMMKNNRLVIKNVQSYLENYKADGQMSNTTANMIMSAMKHLNGLQQEVFYRLMSASNLKTKYEISEDEMEQFQLNLQNKINSLLSEAQKF